MKFKDIENILGQETLTDLQAAIASALAGGDGEHSTVCALREFLVGMLAAIVTTRTYLPLSEQLAADDATQLIALVKKIKEITSHQLGATRSASTAVAIGMQRPPASATEQRPAHPSAAFAAEQTGHVVQLPRCRAHTAAGPTDSHKVIPFPEAVRQPQAAPEAMSTTRSEFMFHMASVHAARSAIARKKELTAQKHEVLARTRSLIAKSLSLRTSLEAVHLGRHF